MGTTTGMRKRALKALGLAMASAALLAGCGSQGTTAPSLTRDTAIAPVAPAPVPPQAIAPGPQGTPAQAAQILAAVAAASRVTRNWTAKAHSEVVAPDGSRNYNTSQLVYKQPGVMAATVLSAKDGKTEGTKLVYRGGADIDVRTYFFGFLAIKLTLKVDDSRLVDAYHRSLRDTQTKQLFDMLLHPAAQATWLGEGRVQGETVDLLDVHSPGSWKDVTHEVVGISRRLALPISRACYDARDRRIFNLELQQMRTNITPKANDFTLD